MTIKIRLLLISFLCCIFFGNAQTVSRVYKIDDLLARLNQTQDTTFVVNFWATWCKPCVQELPAFDSLSAVTKNKAVKVILVSLDFKEDLESKVNPFLAKKKIQSSCVLLDEINGNDFVNKISESWSGAIPATLFKKGKSLLFFEKKMNLSELQAHLSLVH
jgi:thiol-disulfide isomerase/thioredoxin